MALDHHARPNGGVANTLNEAEAAFRRAAAGPCERLPEIRCGSLHRLPASHVSQPLETKKSRRKDLRSKRPAHPEADGVDPDAGVEPEAEGRAEVPGSKVPGTAADDTATSA